MGKTTDCLKLIIIDYELDAKERKSDVYSLYKASNIPKNIILIVLFCVYQCSGLFVPPSFCNTLLRLMKALWVRIRFRPDLESLSFSSGMMPENN